MEKIMSSKSHYNFKCIKFATVTATILGLVLGQANAVSIDTEKRETESPITSHTFRNLSPEEIELLRKDLTIVADSECVEAIQESLVSFLKRIRQSNGIRVPRQDDGDDGDDGDGDGDGAPQNGGGLLGAGNNGLLGNVNLPPVVPQVIGALTEAFTGLNQVVNATSGQSSIPSLLFSGFSNLFGQVTGQKPPPITPPPYFPVPPQRPLGPGAGYPPNSLSQGQRPGPGGQFGNNPGPGGQFGPGPAQGPGPGPGFGPGQGQGFGPGQGQGFGPNGQPRPRPIRPKPKPKPRPGPSEPPKSSLWNIYKSFRPINGPGALTDFQLAHPSGFHSELLSSISSSLNKIRGTTDKYDESLTNSLEYVPPEPEPVVPSNQASSFDIQGQPQPILSNKFTQNLNGPFNQNLLNSQLNQNQNQNNQINANPNQPNQDQQNQDPNAQINQNLGGNQLNQNLNNPQLNQINQLPQNNQLSQDPNNQLNQLGANQLNQNLNNPQINPNQVSQIPQNNQLIQDPNNQINQNSGANQLNQNLNPQINPNQIPQNNQLIQNLNDQTNQNLGANQLNQNFNNPQINSNQISQNNQLIQNPNLPQNNQIVQDPNAQLNQNLGTNQLNQNLNNPQINPNQINQIPQNNQLIQDQNNQLNQNLIPQLNPNQVPQNNLLVQNQNTQSNQNFGANQPNQNFNNPEINPNQIPQNSQLIQDPNQINQIPQDNQLIQNPNNQFNQNLEANQPNQNFNNQINPNQIPPNHQLIQNSNNQFYQNFNNPQINPNLNQIPPMLLQNPNDLLNPNLGANQLNQNFNNFNNPQINQNLNHIPPMLLQNPNDLLNPNLGANQFNQKFNNFNNPQLNQNFNSGAPQTSPQNPNNHFRPSHQQLQTNSNSQPQSQVTNTTQEQSTNAPVFEDPYATERPTALLQQLITNGGIPIPSDILSGIPLPPPTPVAEQKPDEKEGNPQSDTEISPATSNSVEVEPNEQFLGESEKATIFATSETSVRATPPPKNYFNRGPYLQGSGPFPPIPTLPPFMKLMTESSISPTENKIHQHGIFSTWNQNSNSLLTQSSSSESNSNNKRPVIINNVLYPDLETALSSTATSTPKSIASVSPSKVTEKPRRRRRSTTTTPSPPLESDYYEDVDEGNVSKAAKG